MYKKYDDFIEKTEIFSDEEKSLEQIQKELLETRKDENGEEINKFITWEGQLFICCEVPLETRGEDQQFLCPQAVYQNGVKVPDIDHFEEERLDFYSHRYDVVNNINAKIRYANYCFQYCEKQKKYKFATDICQLLYKKIKNIQLGHECTVSFSRLFELALTFSNKEIIQRLDDVVDNLISRKCCEGDYLYILAMSRIVTNNLLNNKKELIKAETQEKFIKIMEQIVNSYFESKEYSLYRNCCTNYLEWLKIFKCQDAIDSVLLKIGESYELDAEINENSYLGKAEYYQLAAVHFANIGERQKVYQLKVKIKDALKNADKENEFKTISATQSISIKQLEEETAVFFRNTIEETLAVVSHSKDFVINKEKLFEDAKEQAKNPLYKFVDFGHIEGNRKVFSTQNDNDVVKHILFQNYAIQLEINFSTIMNFIWDKMISMGLTTDMVIARICEDNYMDETQKEIISVGISDFFKDDYVSALHVLVPQFESYFRTFFEWGGFPTTSLKNFGLQYEQNFNDFIRQEYVKESLDTDLLFMIEFVMVEQLGKNLRNNIAHGLSDIKVFRKNNCLIVIYLFWMITSIKWKF